MNLSIIYMYNSHLEHHVFISIIWYTCIVMKMSLFSHLKKTQKSDIRIGSYLIGTRSDWFIFPKVLVIGQCIAPFFTTPWLVYHISH